MKHLESHLAGRSRRAAHWGLQLILFLAFAACGDQRPLPPVLLSVTPSIVSDGVQTSATILGRNLFGRVQNDVDSGSPPVINLGFHVFVGDTRIPDQNVQFVSTGQLDVIFPSGLTAGQFDLTVVTPQGMRATLSNALMVVNGPVNLTISIEDAPDGNGIPIGAQSLAPGETLDAYAVLRDVSNLFAGNLSVSWSLTASIGSLSASTGPMTTLTAQAVGVGRIHADNVDYGSAETADLTVGAGMPDHLVLVAAPQASAVAGAIWTTDGVNPIQVEVRDAFDNLVTGASDLIAVSVSGGSGALAGTLSQGASGGIATFSDLSYTVAENVTIQFASDTPGVPALTGITVTVNPAPADHLAFGTAPGVTQTAGTAWTSFTVRVEDQFNNLVSTDNTTSVTLLEDGAGSFGGTNPRTVSGGIATFNDITYAVAETINVSAMGGVLVDASAVSVTVNPDAADHLAFGTAPGGTQTAGSTWASFTVRVEDQFNNLVTSDNTTSVTLLEDGAGGFGGTPTRTASGGIATFNDITYTVAETIDVSAMGGALVDASAVSVTVNPAPADHLAFGTAPGMTQTAGATWASFTVRVEDQFNNLVSTDNTTSVTLLEDGAGSFGGTNPRTVSDGIATFNDVTYAVAETINVSAMGGLLVDASAVSVTVDPAPADHLAFGTAPGGTQTAGSTWASFTVRVEDQFNNLVTGDNTTSVTLLEDGAGSFGGTPAQTASGGIATFNDITYTVAETINVSAMGGVLVDASAVAVTVNPGTADHLSFGTAPGGTQTAGATWASLTVRVEDQFNNLVNTDNTTSVTLLEDGSGGFGGTNPRTASGGIATFNDITYTVAETINVSAMGGALVDASPVAVTVNPAPADHLAFGTAPGMTQTAGATWASLTVRVEDQFNNLVTGDNTTSVTLLEDGAGSFGGTNPRTVSGGIATFNDITYAVAETINVSAMGGVLVDAPAVSVTVNPGSADHLAFGTAPGMTQTAGATWASFTVRVEDQFNNLVTGDNTTSVTLLEDGSGSFGGTNPRTASGGIATFSDITYAVAETINVSAMGGALVDASPVAVTVNPDVADHLAFGTAPASPQTAGTTWASLTVRVEDQFNNLVSTDNTTSVTLLEDGSGGFGGTNPRTASGGIATFSDITYAVAETINVSAMGGVLLDAPAVSVTVNPAPADHLAFGTAPGMTQTAGVTWASFTVRVEDQFNNLVSTDNTTSVTLLEDGAGVFGGTNPRTASGGIATFNDITYAVAETINVSAMGGVLVDASPVAVTVNPDVADHLAFGTAPGATQTAGATWASLTVRVEDQFNNLVNTDNTTSVTLLEDGAGGFGGTNPRTASGGIATFNDITYAVAETINVSAMGGALGDASAVSVTVNPAPADHLAFGTAPGTTQTAGATWASLTVRVEDQFNNLVTGDNTTSVTLLEDGAGSFGGTPTRTASGGIATFSDITYAVAETINVSAMGGALVDALSVAVTVNPGIADHLAFGTAPGATQTAGATWASLTVRVEDQFNNLVNTDNTTSVTLLEDGSGGFGGTPTGTAVNGIATFSDITYSVAEMINVSAMGGVLVDASAVSVTVNPDVADHLAFGTAPGMTQTAGATWASFTVRVEDQFNNLVNTDNTTSVTLLGDGVGSFGGTPTRTASGGIATFNDITYAVAETINVSAMGGVLVDASAVAVTVNPAPADHLAFGTAPGMTQTAGATWASFTVRVEDQFNNLVTGDNTTSVTLLEDGSGGFGGTNPRTASGGIATFNDITYAVAETINVSAMGGALVDAPAVSVTVNAGTIDHVVIEYGAGDPLDEIGTDTLSIGQTLDVFAVGRDAFENFVSNEAVTWSVSGSIGTIPSGPSASATFSATTTGTGMISADHPNVAVSDDTTGTITVAGMCGNNLIETGEVCDGTDLGGQTCLSLGYRDGGGTGPTCNAGCGSFDVSQCLGGAIDSLTQLQDAINDAYGTVGHELISIQSGSYTFTSSITLDECTGACTGGKPYGVTLQPLDGEVALIRDTFAAAAIDVYTGNNIIRGIHVQDANIGVRLNTGPDSGGNVISNMFFESVNNTPTNAVVSLSINNVLEANRFLNATGASATSAIDVGGEGNVITMNVIYGPYQTGITGTALATTVFIDHNSIQLTGGATNSGIDLLNVTKLCYRNNIIYGDGASTGLALANVTFDSAANCGGTASQSNVNLNYGTECTGAACATLCTGGNSMCDNGTDPGFTDSLLCLGSGNGLIDTGLDLGYDMWDDNALDFNGTAPEVGARESGTSRYFGGTLSSCP